MSPLHECNTGNSIWKQKYSEAKYSGPKWMGLRDWGLDRTDRLIARTYSLSRLDSLAVVLRYGAIIAMTRSYPLNDILLPPTGPGFQTFFCLQRNTDSLLV
ncbi:hypothetical protein M0802_003228 [Mischocyttarus mexicanus]|nr:hypothetical protein M0802_003228 [Mischocyttarus mexicanus]